jgi:adenine-specific DNA methylase
MRILRDGLGKDAPLLAADLDDQVGKHYRPLEPSEIAAIDQARADLARQPRFGVLLSARPDEPIPAGNTWTVQATVYGTKTYGDMMNDRQTLSFVTICRIINDLAKELTTAGCSNDYVRALTGYATAAMSRKIRRATRGSTLDSKLNKVNDLFATESSLNFSFDYFEVGLAGGPGSWDSVAGGTLSALAAIIPSPGSAEPCDVDQGSATALMLPDRSITAVITDPPYDAMIDYTDASDLFYVWIKRALANSWPEIGITAHGDGLQDKRLEIIVKKGGTSNKDHRDRKHYDTLITEAFTEAQRVVSADGVVTIVFGHGEPEVWQRLLAAIENAKLVLTAAWPAKTEQGGKAGFSNIVTTLTMACRPAPGNRLPGRKGVVDNLIKAEIKRRYPDWERWGLAPADMLMAAAGPAMEVVGRYSHVLDAKGERVDIHTFLPLARAAVQEAMAVEVDDRPLDSFDARTRFALWWVRLYGRQIQAKSELRWQALASSMDSDAVRDLIIPADKGVAFTTSSRFKTHITPNSAVIDVVLALAAASEDGVATMGETLAASGRTSDDPYLWAAVKFLADRLPSSDPDGMALTRVLRTRDAISNAASTIASDNISRQRDQQREDLQLKLL